ncbi:hypothetical protein CYMTET_45110 [Cymbomonas tetramitiformis]|uniref:Uncharacterized protein n=1 Tax=Cymbomonas tetramitiformis TaxID=36881 RepID=A0AAE0EYM5_9CHLO|nr:hypothetical protein CYMTET_45110 [Cymbomonas tetramitiformis]
MNSIKLSLDLFKSVATCWAGVSIKGGQPVTLPLARPNVYKPGAGPKRKENPLACFRAEIYASMAQQPEHQAETSAAGAAAGYREMLEVARQHPIHEYPILTHPDLGIIVAEPLPVTDTRDDDPNIEWTAEANQGLHYIPLKALETAEQARLLAYFTDHETGAFTPMDMIVQGRPKPSHTRLRRMGLEAATYIEAAGPSVATIPQSL